MILIVSYLLGDPLTVASQGAPDSGWLVCVPRRGWWLVGDFKEFSSLWTWVMALVWRDGLPVAAWIHGNLAADVKVMSGRKC